MTEAQVMSKEIAASLAEDDLDSTTWTSPARTELRDSATGRIISGLDGNDMHANVEFFVKPILDKKATFNKGNNVYKDVDHIRITTPSNNYLDFVEVVGIEHIIRFPIDYKNFKNDQIRAAANTQTTTFIEALEAVRRVFK